MLTITCNLDRQENLMVLPGKPYGSVHITATVTDDNPAINLVGASLDWNDGSPPVQFTPGHKPISLDTTRNLRLGTYFITILAWNYIQPNPQQIAFYSTVTIQPEQLVPTVDKYLFGPILPMDDGPPNAETQWNFSVGYNLDVLKSSVKMLLITTKGERVMNPTYGTNLRRCVFEPNDGNVTSTIQQEIDEAINQFEPRVSLEGFEISRPGPREVLLNAIFLSKMNQQTFNLVLPFSQT